LSALEELAIGHLIVVVGAQLGEKGATPTFLLLLGGGEAPEPAAVRSDAGVQSCDWR